MRLFHVGRFNVVGALLVALSLVLAASAAAGQGDKPGEKKQPAKMDQAQRMEAQALIALTDDFANGKPPANPLAMKWEQNHFIKALADRTYVPFTLAFEPGALTGPAVSVYLRVVAKGSPAVAPPPVAEKKKDDKKDSADQPSPFAYWDVFFVDVPPATGGEPQRLRRAFDVPPGSYDVYVAVKQRGAAGADASAGKAGVIKQEIVAPDLSGREFTTSSVILAQAVEVLESPLAQDRQAENPYTIGPMKIVPSTDGKFSKKGTVTVIFWIYGAKAQEGTKKPDISIDYKFYQKAGEQETYFNKTAPQLLNAETLPPQFDLDAGHVLPGSLELPLNVFPEGDYRLAIEVQDKVAGQKLARDVTFSVSAQ
jgi:hypothetical protein